MTDLTGRSPTWSPRARALWGDCLRRATRAADSWTERAWQGDESLRDQLGRVLGLDPEHLTITSGVRAAALTYARTERVIVMERPGFDGATFALRDSRSRLLHRSWEHLLQGELPAGSALWLTHPARNPDGRTLTHAELRLLTDRIAQGHRVVLNSAYHWYAPTATRPEGADLVGGLHKIAGLGARIGWVHSRDYFARARPEIIATTPPQPWQRAWALFAAEGGLEDLAAWVTCRARTAVQVFGAAVGEPYAPLIPDTGPHALLPLAPGTDEKTAREAVARDGFVLTAGSCYGPSRPALRATFTDVPPYAAERFGRYVAGSPLFAPAPPGPNGSHPPSAD
ncbi:aminotransferase class I/II-fold pyridoxal phosphate-dependent enzyme [Streptomyces sp. NPDC059104]|uniref:aminotransferase class I/II-fold pyridoxal phosphate-dependent enzyme n=1 Tax=Streptomyces sp. NPDC059104 TaxID=3346729 RepID=UPI00369FB11B